MNRHLISIALGTLALAAAPLAFAQSTTTPPAEPQQEAAPAQQATAPQEAPAPQADAAPKQISWSQLDTDGDGKLSKEEAAPVDSLSQAFDSADADKDGALTADEYKAYLGTRQQSPEPATPPEAE